MKIYAINNVKMTSNNNSIQHITTTKTNQNCNLFDSLQGVPRSYFNFKGISEDRRNKDINLYLHYKDRAKEFADNSTIYLERADAKINKLIKERSHYGWFSREWKVGKVSDTERAKIKKECYEEFLKGKKTFDQIMKNESYYKSLISTNDIEIYNHLKQCLQNKANSISNKIAGYSKLKNELHNILIAPIQRETVMGIDQKIPNSILLYGPIGCGKSQMATALAEESGCNIIKLSPTTKPATFIYELSRAILDAKKHYCSQVQANKDLRASYSFKNKNCRDKAKELSELKSPRTILIIDEIDKYLNPDSADNSVELADINKTYLKGLLDHCSEKMDPNNSKPAVGMTIIFTTNFPTQVDSEISLRGGKCTRFAVDVPNKDDIVEIMKLYMNKENIRILEHKSKGKAVEPVDINQIPFSAYAKLSEPSSTTGAISGAGIEQAVSQSVTNYINNPNDYINIQLAKMLSQSKYRVSPEKIAEYNKEITAMGSPYSDIDEKEEYELLNEAFELNLLNSKQSERLQHLKSIFDARRNNAN